MPGPLMQKPTFPSWYDPAQASVFDVPGQGLLRKIVGLLGLDDPNQVMALGTPLEAGSMTGGLLEKVAERFPRTAQAIKAFHGSPHDFDQFSTAKIGTGEGAQAYGHGLYFAENPAIAKSYRDQLSRAYSGSPEALAQDALRSANGDSTQAAAKIHDALAVSARVEQVRAIQRTMADAPVFNSPAYDALEREHYDLQQRIYDALPNAPTGLGHHEFKQQADAALAALNSGKPLQGRMYEVAINANPDHFLDWDKPLSQQSAHVQQAFEDALPVGMRERWKQSGAWEHVTGKSLYQQLEGELAADPGAWKNPSEYASQLLHQIGDIPGIKYLDQGSRGVRPAYTADLSFLHAAQSFKQSGADPETTIAGLKQAYSKADPSHLQAAVAEAFDLKPKQTSNYVVFDDKTVEILRKYGILPPMAGAALANQSQPQGQQ